MKQHIPLKDLEIYKLSRDLSRMAWRIYIELHWKDQKTMGEQFIRSADSVGANIAEGYARFHFMDKLKFFYYSRASLSEAYKHWVELLYEREKISEEKLKTIQTKAITLRVKLSNYIKAVYKNGQLSKGKK